MAAWAWQAGYPRVAARRYGRAVRELLVTAGDGAREVDRLVQFCLVVYKRSCRHGLLLFMRDSLAEPCRLHRSPDRNDLLMSCYSNLAACHLSLGQAAVRNGQLTPAARRFHYGNAVSCAEQVPLSC